MKKYKWLREDALGKTITEEDCVRLGRNPYHWRNFLDGCVLEKVVNEDDAISLREFLDRWGHKSRYILLSICTIKSSHLRERVLIDSGYEDPSEYTVSCKAKKFIESRNLARLAAMLTLRGMRQRRLRRKTPLLRDVAPMVARLIWGSRGMRRCILSGFNEMKGFEWLLEEPDLNGLITNVHMKRFHAHGWHFDVDMSLIDCVAKIAVEKNNNVLLRFALDRGFNKYSALAQSLMDISLIACEFVFIDAGLSIHGNCWQSSKKLVECRNRARFAAILVMRAMQEMRKGYKNVSIIIGRAIWESRGQLDNWLKE